MLYVPPPLVHRFRVGRPELLQQETAEFPRIFERLAHSDISVRAMCYTRNTGDISRESLCPGIPLPRETDPNTPHHPRKQSGTSELTTGNKRQFKEMSRTDA